MMKPEFNKYPDGLVPAVIQDDNTRKVLMLGYMNEEALSRTILEEVVTFYSRSKGRLWTKGESSGNYLRTKSILLDCDQDCLLIKVIPDGPVCHSGADTCFAEPNQSLSFLPGLEDIIAERIQNKEQSSYVSGLFAKGINKIAQKVGEEAVELIIEAKDDNGMLFKNEAADLLFHYLLLLQAKGLRLAAIEDVLLERNRNK